MLPVCCPLMVIDPSSFPSTDFLYIDQTLCKILSQICLLLLRSPLTAFELNPGIEHMLLLSQPSCCPGARWTEMSKPKWNTTCSLKRHAIFYLTFSCSTKIYCWKSPAHHIHLLCLILHVRILNLIRRAICKNNLKREVAEHMTGVFLWKNSKASCSGEISFFWQLFLVWITASLFFFFFFP